MVGSYMVILWLLLFFIVSYALCNYLKLKTALLCTIFVWTFCMIFVSIFEMMLLFHNKYLEKKGNYYYDNNSCYWNENQNIMDMFTYKMYMDLYADYSLCDKRYCQNMVKNEGFRFVFLGEIIHGFFCIIMSMIIMYFYFVQFNELYIYLFAIIFTSSQFALILWYLTSVFLEMNYVENTGFVPYPLLWNVPWVILPLYVIYGCIVKIQQMTIRK